MRSDWPTPNVPYLKANDVCCVVREPLLEDDIPIEEKPLRAYSVAILRIVDAAHPAVNEFGLYAAEPIPPHSFVCNYIGRVHLQTEYPDSDYAVTYFGEYALDATHTGNEARFINDYRNIASRPNVAFDTYKDVDGMIQVGVWSLNKPIVPGEEILGNYGKGYWRARGVKGVLGPDWDDSWD
ncbi:SET domain protein [Thraustotheca clavata]|uniref:SET domain protein n=1 Tax=Thraustotheca clavata TaxID=74557 RepID=A0A1W0ABY5_9STRA|nr:SET domain protein [Thraustotheca clavata]